MDVIWGLPEEKKMQIITMWWLWWQERNNVREGAIPCIPDVLVHRVKCTIAGYMACSLKPSKAPKLREGKWSPPADGIVKINSDGAYVPGEDHGGWGVIAGTSQGEVVVARAGCSDGIHDPFTAELKAMEEALNLAAELGVIGVEFETDAQLLAMALNSKKPDCSSEAEISQEGRKVEDPFKIIDLTADHVGDQTKNKIDLPRMGVVFGYSPKTMMMVFPCEARWKNCHCRPRWRDGCRGGNQFIDRASADSLELRFQLQIDDDKTVERIDVQGRHFIIIFVRFHLTGDMDYNHAKKEEKWSGREVAADTCERRCGNDPSDTQNPFE
ncbi:hypothetical protein ZWY2020_053041 [Hordeum vulgare]|nr:hypothetical protein ZWY2020_053041 [Hordeum vulgare]